MNQLSDLELVKKVSEGEQSAFDQLFRKYYSRLRAYAFQITSDALTAEDIVQDIFCQFWISRQKLIILRSVHAYLKVTTLNRCIDYLRKHNPSASIRYDSNQFIENEGLYTALLQYQEDNLITRELSAAISKSVEELPDQCRTVFRMSRYIGMKNFEIAVNLDISVKAVEKHMTKALSHLRTSLKDFLSILLFLSI